MDEDRGTVVIVVFFSDGSVFVCLSVLRFCLSTCFVLCLMSRASALGTSRSKGVTQNFSFYCTFTMEGNRRGSNVRMAWSSHARSTRSTCKLGW